MLAKHEEVCLIINGAQSVRKTFKQIPVPFKTYADFKGNLKKVVKVLIQKNIKIVFLVVLLTNLFVLMMNLLSQ